jgi:Protein of unknown function (DUF1203)
MTTHTLGAFRIQGLAPDEFRPLFDLSDQALAARNARRVIADARPGFPCRVSLAYAEVGETVLLVNHEHQAAATPFRSSYAIYVRAAAHAKVDRIVRAPDDVPEPLRISLLSLRGFSHDHMLAACDVVAGADLEAAVARLFADDAVAYVHAHYAKAGCYAARQDRA